MEEDTVDDFTRLGKFTLLASGYGGRVWIIGLTLGNFGAHSPRRRPPPAMCTRPATGTSEVELPGLGRGLGGTTPH